MNGTLTTQEENIIKDILQVLACDPKTTEIIRRRHALLPKKEFDAALDSIFKKCETVVES
jgi:hypothetical protein